LWSDERIHAIRADARFADETDVPQQVIGKIAEVRVIGRAEPPVAQPTLGGTGEEASAEPASRDSFEVTGACMGFLRCGARPS
jgi:hypothetical protein